ncbi:MAG: GTPase ObgE [Planctomycetota bacterium]
MHFVDEAQIYVKAGDGGDGCASFLREKYVPKGGPNGGDGGHGGDIIIEADENLSTLTPLYSQKEYVAEDGQPGQPKNRDGRDGDDVVVKVPVGTILKDVDTGLTLRDLTQDGQRVTVAAGGRGGKGNTHFATATNQAPTKYEEGTQGDERNIHLELKLIADVGLVGKPNAGKSTLLSHISAAHPQVASYPFTTLEPHLGIVDTGNYTRFTVADLPGLIEGAHKGRGLGDEFLKHIERTRLLVHVVDTVPMDGSAPADAYTAIRQELEQYSGKLAARPEIVAANKIDMPEAGEGVDNLRETIDAPVLPISAVNGDGLRELVGQIVETLETLDTEQVRTEEPDHPEL